MTRDKFATSATPKFVSFSVDSSNLPSPINPSGDAQDLPSTAEVPMGDDQKLPTHVETAPGVLQDPPISVEAPPTRPTPMDEPFLVTPEVEDPLVPQTSSPKEHLKSSPSCLTEVSDSGDDSQIETVFTDNLSTVER